MIVVSDTAPLRYLAVLGQLDLLPALFGEVRCSQQVLAECWHPRAPQMLRDWATSPPAWLVCETVQEIDAKYESLDIGEASALTLAVRLGASLVLIDERKGRRIARETGLRVAGTLNILAAAAQRGLADFENMVERLKLETNFRISEAVIEEIRRQLKA